MSTQREIRVARQFSAEDQSQLQLRASYREAHEAVAQAAAKCADLIGAYDGAVLVSDIADALFDLFEDTVCSDPEARARISSFDMARIEMAVHGLSRAMAERSP